MAQDHEQYARDVTRHFNEGSFEPVTCPLCSSTSRIDLFEKYTMFVVRCSCGFVYNSRQPTKETLDKFYKESAAMTKWVDIKKSSHEDQRQSEKYADALAYLSKENVRSVLDLGCGTGKFLRQLRATLGPEARLVGVDQHSPSLLEAVAPNIQFIEKDLMEYLTDPLTPNFEAVTLWGVLEHYKNPVDLLFKLSLKLTGPKIVIVCVPNVESEVVERLWGECFTFCPQHLWYFSEKSLSEAFRKAGLQVEDLKTIEGESLPVRKKRAGFAPYDEIPPWAISLLPPITDEQILKDKKGYKLVAYGSTL